MAGTPPRERLSSLLDPGSFEPSKRRDGSPAVAGVGRVDGATIGVYVLDGPSAQDWRDAAALVRRAGAEGFPAVGWFGDLDPGDDVQTLQAVGELLREQSTAPVPQLAVVTGETGGAAAFAATAGEVLIMVEPAAVLRLVDAATIGLATGDDLDPDALGGAAVHAVRTGLAHHRAADRADAAAFARRWLAMIADRDITAAHPIDPEPTNDRTPAPLGGGSDELTDQGRDELPDDVVDELLPDLLDAGDLLELQPEHAPQLLTGLGRIDGRPVGVLADRRGHRSGALDAAATLKAARFVRSCDRLGLPVITLVDRPGFVPGAAEEWGGIVRHGAELAKAYATARMPTITVIARSGGPAGLVLGSRSVGADLTLAWPGAVPGADPVAAGLADRALPPKETRSAVAAALRHPTVSDPAGARPAVPAGPATVNTAGRPPRGGTLGPIEVLRGHPTDPELAAVVAVLAAVWRPPATGRAETPFPARPPAGANPGRTEAGGPAGPSDPAAGWSRHWRTAATRPADRL